MIRQAALMAVLGLAACAPAPGTVGQAGAVSPAVPSGGASPDAELRDQDLARAGNALRDPATRAALMQRCEARQRTQSAATLADMARFMGVATAAAPQVFCARMTQAVVDGRLTAADLNSPAGGALSPRVVSVLQGRR